MGGGFIGAWLTFTGGWFWTFFLDFFPDLPICPKGGNS